MTAHTVTKGAMLLDDDSRCVARGDGLRHYNARMPDGPTTQAAPAVDPRQGELAMLVARMAAGDEAALASLYDATVARVYGLALRICANTQLAEEVTADVFHQCWREASRYRPARGKVTTWLLMICRSRAIDAVRARDGAFLHEAPESLVAEQEQAREGDPQDLLDLAQSSTALHAALAQLSSMQRQMIGLAFFRGLSHQEIAAHARIPLGTVKAHIRRALGLLRSTLPGTEEHHDNQPTQSKQFRPTG